MLARYRRDVALIQPAAARFLMGSALLGAAHAVPWTLMGLYLDRRGFDKADIGLIHSAESWGMVLVALPAALLFGRLRTPPPVSYTHLTLPTIYSV